MDVAARVSSKGQITIPRAVREALGIKEGMKSYSGSRGSA